jgi:hypothetical protein
MRTLLLGLLAALTPLQVSAQAPPLASAGSAEPISDVRRSYPIHAGPFYLRPALSLKEMGVDTNVFNTAGEQKSDFTFTLTPQVDVAVPVARRALVEATLGTDVVYYAHFDKERSLNAQGVVRAEFYLQRVTLYVEEAYINSRERANYEIDQRARRLQNDIEGGLSVRLTPKFSVSFSKRLGETRFDDDAVFLGQRLQDTLNQTSDTYAVTARHKRSPLTTLGVRYERQEDRFPLSPVRDTDSFRVMPGVEFKPRALISGSAWVGYRNFVPRNSLLPAQSGLVSQLALSYTLLGATTFGVTYDRDFQFAFEVARPYFVDNGVGLFVRRAIAGKFDVVANAARHRYAYQPFAVQAADSEPVRERIDTTDNYGLNLGYRAKRQTRIGLGVSYWTRASPLETSREYDGLRIGTTVTYGF